MNETYWLLMLLYPTDYEQKSAIIQTGKAINSDEQSMIVGIYDDLDTAMRMRDREARRNKKPRVRYMVMETGRQQIEQIRAAGIIEGDPPRLVME